MKGQQHMPSPRDQRPELTANAPRDGCTLARAASASGKLRSPERGPAEAAYASP